MKNLKQLSLIAMCAVFATMQISTANDLTTPLNTGLGSNYGGAEINSITGGYAGHNITGNSATLQFNDNSLVNWNRLNLNSGETLNFNAVDNASGLTVLNTVNQGMSNIHGAINSNAGISKLIISNPNGVLFDGASFATAGDTIITTKNMTGVNPNNITSGTWGTLKSDPSTGVKIQVLNNSDFSVGGEFTIIAPRIEAHDSAITAGKGLKLITANGADYAAQGINGLGETKGVTFLKAMEINGNVEIVNNVGALSISDGTSITGDLKAEVGGYGVVYGADADNKIEVTGDVDLTGHGQQLILRNAEVGGNVTMANDGGAVEINNATVGKNANLTTTGWQPVNHKKFNHYVHVNGNTDIKGDLNISSSQNIHIGNYKVTNDPYSNTKTSNNWAGDLLPGKLTVGGDIKAEVTDGGHIMTTIDTEAKNIDYTAKSHVENGKAYGGNILSDDKATITANTYKFKSDGYIGGLKASDNYKVDDKIVHIMEEYQFIPADTSSHEYMNIGGGTITKLETPKTASVYINSKDNLTVTGANAGQVNLVAPDKKITITGPNVEANDINIGGRTGTLQLDLPNRKFTTHYTKISDGKVTTIAPDEEITYELANAPKAYNSPDYQQTDGTNTTYLVAPGKGPNPKPVNPPNDDNVRVFNPIPEDPMKPLVNTPVAYAADLDDDDPSPCRKNVDGSVTVVRAYPVIK